MSRELGKALAQSAVESRYGNLGPSRSRWKRAEFRNLLVNEEKVLSALIKEQKILD